MKGGYYAGVIARFIERVQNNEPPIIYGDGKQTRDFVYVKDVARANIIALKSKKTGPFNIGTGVQISINDLCSLLLKILNKPHLKPIYQRPRPGDIRYSQADITKARNELYWVPEYTLEKGLQETIRYHGLNKQ